MYDFALLLRFCPRFLFPQVKERPVFDTTTIAPLDLRALTLGPPQTEMIEPCNRLLLTIPAEGDRLEPVAQ